MAEVPIPCALEALGVDSLRGLFFEQDGLHRLDASGSRRISSALVDLDAFVPVDRLPTGVFHGAALADGPGGHLRRGPAEHAVARGAVGMKRHFSELNRCFERRSGLARFQQLQTSCHPERSWRESPRVCTPSRISDGPRSPILLAGESHMVFRQLLHCFAREILKRTPGPWRTSDGSVHEDISAAAGPARGQCETRTSGGAVHRVGRSAVRSGVVCGYSRLRTIEGRVVAARRLVRCA